MHEVLVNRLGGLSLPRKSVVRLTDRPDMTLDVYRGRKTTLQHYNLSNLEKLFGGRQFSFLPKAFPHPVSQNVLQENESYLVLPCVQTNFIRCIDIRPVTIFHIYGYRNQFNLFRHYDSRLGSMTLFLFRSIPCIYIDNQGCFLVSTLRQIIMENKKKKKKIRSGEGVGER